MAASPDVFTVVRGADAWSEHGRDRESFDVPAGESTAKLTNFSVRLEGVTDDVIIIAAPRDIPSQARVETLTYTSATGVLARVDKRLLPLDHTRRRSYSSPPRTRPTAVWVYEHFLDTSEIADRVSAIVSISGLGKVAAGTESAHSLSAGVTSARNTTPGGCCRSLAMRSTSRGSTSSCRVCGDKRPTARWLSLKAIRSPGLSKGHTFNTSL